MEIQKKCELQVGEEGKVELEMASQENEPDKDFLLDIQKRLVKALKIKQEIHAINQDNNLDIFLQDL